MDALLRNDFGFVHFFHGEQSARLLHLYVPDFAEAPLPDHLIKVEILLPYLLILAFVDFRFNEYFVLRFFLFFT